MNDWTIRENFDFIRCQLAEYEHGRLPIAYLAYWLKTMSEVVSWYERSDIDFPEDNRAQAICILFDAISKWLKDNPDLWQQIMDAAHKEALQENNR